MAFTISYKTRRWIDANTRISKEAKNNAYQRFIDTFYARGIQVFGQRYEIPLFNYLYTLREK